MSRRGNCWDYAAVESFFGTLKTELVHEGEFATHLAAKIEFTEYLEGFYNSRRRHSSLGYLSPLMFELQRGSGKSKGSAPAPPGTSEGRNRGQEKPDLAAQVRCLRDWGRPIVTDLSPRDKSANPREV